MEAKRSETVVVVLTMNAEEASWLQCMLNNPITPGEPEEENDEDKMFREPMLRALNDGLGLTTERQAVIDAAKKGAAGIKGPPVEEITCTKCGVTFIPAWRYPGTKGITNCTCGKRYEKATT